MRIAMWSGPRNLSTAMMYSFAARGDCAIWDEPFYAAYLRKTGLTHPMRAEIIAAHESDPTQVASHCSGPIPKQMPHFYMKHMAQHMVPGMPLDWAKDCVNIHLIRHPARVVASYAAKREDPTLDDIGFAQQQSLYNLFGGIIIDSNDIRANPGAMLQTLCKNIGLNYTPKMLQWPAGGHADDGVWAAHWYGAVHKSTGFAGPEGRLPNLPENYAEIADQALPFYENLSRNKLRPATSADDPAPPTA